jgi:erythromycin esterase
MTGSKRSTLLLILICLLSQFERAYSGPQQPVGKVPAGVAADTPREVRIAYLKKHAVPVRSIDPKDGDFADLEPLRDVIGGRRVVMLGEATHGDGATFAAKVRLIRFLHERMGFDVLAFESGFYEVRKAWSGMRAGEDPLDAVDQGIDAIWGDSLQTQPLWSYLAAQELAGFDPQFTGTATHDSLLKDLGDYLSRADLSPDAAGTASRVTDALALIAKDPGFLQNGSEFKRLRPEDREAARSAFRALGQALSLLRASGEPEMLERDFWIQFLKSSAAFLEQSRLIDLDALPTGGTDAAINLRDHQMGENFLWLAQRAFPTRKVIVWAATSHIIRRRYSMAGKRDPMIPMGEWIDKAMGSEVYVLGFTAYKGRWATIHMPEATELEAAAPNSLEDLMFAAGLDSAWLDFRNLPAEGAWLRVPLSCRVLRYLPTTTDWSRFLDGVFFIKETFPSGRVEKARSWRLR